MDEKQLNGQHYEDEIDLKELVFTLWKQKYIIIGITLIGAILAGIFSVFIVSPVYDTKLNIVISMPETYDIGYRNYTLPDSIAETYTLPITSHEQYINLITSNDVLTNTISDMGYSNSTVSLENLKKRISIDQGGTKPDSVQNSFGITVSANNAAESLKLAETLYDNYIEFINVMTTERAVDYYYNKFSVSLKSLEVSLKSDKEILKKNEELLAQTPQTINQKEAMQEIQGATINTSDFVVLENIINTNYTIIENDIIKNKQSINNTQDFMRIYNDYLEELDIEKKAIAKYYETGKAGKLESSITGIAETCIYLPSNPVAPNQKTSPSNAMNVAIGIVLGGMLGVMIVLIKEWLKKD